MFDRTVTKDLSTIDSSWNGEIVFRYPKKEMLLKFNKEVQKLQRKQKEYEETEDEDRANDAAEQQLNMAYGILKDLFVKGTLDDKPLKVEDLDEIDITAVNDLVGFLIGEISKKN